MQERLSNNGRSREPNIFFAQFQGILINLWQTLGKSAYISSIRNRTATVQQPPSLTSFVISSALDLTCIKHSSQCSLFTLKIVYCQRKETKLYIYIYMFMRYREKYIPYCRTRRDWSRQRLYSTQTCYCATESTTTKSKNYYLVYGTWGLLWTGNPVSAIE